MEIGFLQFGVDAEFVVDVIGTTFASVMPFVEEFAAAVGQTP